MENKGHGKTEKHAKTGENIGSKLGKTEESIGKRGKTQENRETRENRKKQGVTVENAGKQWKTGEIWKKLKEI